MIINDSKELMQSVELSYARYEFFKEKGIEINIQNYKKLFISQKQLKKQYGLLNKELLELYPYQEKIETKKKVYTI